MLRYIVIAIFSFVLGAIVVKSCDTPKTTIKKFTVNKHITDTLIQKVMILQERKKEVKLTPLKSIEWRVDSFSTIDTSARELIKDLVVQISKRDTIISIDSMQIKALIDISEIQMKQIDTIQNKLNEATQINEVLVTQANKPKKALRYSVIANIVLFIGLLLK